MRCALLLVLTLVPLIVNAETSYVTGAATYHLLGTREQDSVKFRNKWSKEGRLIGTPVIGLLKTSHNEDGYVTTSYFLGQNSMGGGMGGVVGSSGIEHGLFRAGVLAGLYLQDASKFYKNEMNVNGIPLNKSLNLTALAGFELVYGAAVKYHLVLTPALILTYLSFTF